MFSNLLYLMSFFKVCCMSKEQCRGAWLYMPYKHLDFFIFVFDQLCKACFTKCVCVWIKLPFIYFIIIQTCMDAFFCYSICSVGILLDVGLSFVIKINNWLFFFKFFLQSQSSVCGQRSSLLQCQCIQPETFVECFCMN